MNLSRATKQQLTDEAEKRGIDHASMTRSQLIDALRSAGVNDEADAAPAEIDREGLIAQAKAAGIQFPVDPQYIADEGLIQLIEQNAEKQMTAAITTTDEPRTINPDGLSALNNLLEKLVHEKDKRDGGLPDGFMTAEDIRRSERDWILIPATAEPGGDLPVKVSVQGFACVIPRDVPCHVPKPVIGVLRDARTTRFEQDGKVNAATGQVEFKQLTSLRFPFMTGDTAQNFERVTNVEEGRYVSPVV